jgi:hypothetical protein
VTTYTVADMRDDLAWVEGRIAEWTEAGGWSESIAKYEACAAELRGLIAAEEFAQAFSSDADRTGRSV